MLSVRPALFLALLCAGLFATPAHAQFVKAHGIKAGVNASRVTFDLEGSGDGFDSRIGLQAGAFVELGPPLLPVSAVVEVEYANRGYERSFANTAPTGEELDTITASTTLHFVSLPALARIMVPGTVAMTPYVLAGPRLDVLAAYHGKEPAGVVLGSDETTDDALPRLFPTVSFSGVVGAGLSLGGLIGPEVRAEVRYGYGLTDLNESELVEMKNRGLDFSVALGF